MFWFNLSNGRPNDVEIQHRTPSQIVMDSVSLKGMHQLNSNNEREWLLGRFQFQTLNKRCNFS